MIKEIEKNQLALQELMNAVNDGYHPTYTRRKFLKSTSISLAGFSTLGLSKNLLFPTSAQASYFALGRVFWFVFQGVLSAVIAEAVDFYINDQGKVAHQDAKILCPKCDKSAKLENGYNGLKAKIHPHYSRCPLSGSYAQVGLDANLVSNLGGSSGRNIRNINRLKGSVMNDDIFDRWKAQGVNVYDYRNNDLQWSMAANIYPSTYSSIINKYNRPGQNISRANSCKNVNKNREPVSITLSHDKRNKVYCFAEVLNSKGKKIDFYWVNPYANYAEKVYLKKKYANSNRYRTYSNKENNPYPGSWAVVIAVNNDIKQVVGFQWA